ncbi:MAG: DUF456 family protein [Rubrivivax sp.]
MMIFLGALLAAWLGHFERIGWPALLLLAVLMVLGLVVDALAAVIGARRVGASRAAVIGSLLGGLIGLFFGLPGFLPLGPFIGAVAGEYLHRRAAGQALRVGVGTWIGLAIGTLTARHRRNDDRGVRRRRAVLRTDPQARRTCKPCPEAPTVRPHSAKARYSCARACDDAGRLSGPATPFRGTHHDYRSPPA